MAQTLTLEVAGRYGAQFGAQRRKVFDGTGGSIGRADDCDWVLPVTAVSRVHAVVRYLNGLYFVEDRSTNGMLLNGQPLVKGDPATLADGDRLAIDTFEVEVQLRDAALAEAGAMAADPFADLDGSGGMPAAATPSKPPSATPAPAPVAAAKLPDDPFGDDFFASPATARAGNAAPAGSAPMVGSSDDALDLLGFGGPAGGAMGGDLIGSGPSSQPDLDPLSFLDLPAPASAAAAPAASGWDHNAGSADHFRPPSMVPPPAAPAGGKGPGGLPEDWDSATGSFAAHAPVPAPAPPPPATVPPPAAEVTARPVASPPVRPVAPAAAPTPTAVTAGATALPADVDEMLRIVVDGVMDVLRARAEIKNTFRLPVTLIQRSENNPLKFAPNPEEAMSKMLAPPNTAFLSGAAAFQDAFDDIRCHQMAMLAGGRAAYDALLAHFAPERSEREVDGGSGKKGGLLDFGGKGGKYWEKYRENYDALRQNPDESFRRLYGDEFARAYEEQLGRLKSALKAARAKGR